jgi:protein SCO1/2
MMSFARRHWLPLAAFVLGAIVLVSSALFTTMYAPSNTPPSPASVGGPFSLTSADGRRVTDKDLQGRPFSVFFGFTHCPEVCPTTLFDLSALLGELGPAADRLRVLFITVDPERDTPELIATYLGSFDPRITGLTGSPDEIAAAARAYRAFYRKVPVAESSGDYTLEHTATVYLMDARGRFVSALDYHEPRDAKLAKLKRLLGAS